MLPHSLINFEIQKNHQNKPKFNGVYSRKNLPKTKDVINLDEYKSIETHWILYMLMVVIEEHLTMQLLVTCN